MGPFAIRIILWMCILVPGGAMWAQEAATSYINRQPEAALKVGDPVSAANGAFSWELPLFNLGGPMDFQLGLRYQSDPAYSYARTPEGFPEHYSGTYGGTVWAWTPAPLGMTYTPRGENLARFQPEAGVSVNFQTNELGQWELSCYPDTPGNGVPLLYQLKQSNDWYYLCDPEQGRVYAFEYVGAYPMPIRYVTDRNGNLLTYTYAATNHLNPASISDQAGRQITFQYRTNAYAMYLTNLTDQAGRSWSFTYAYGIDAADNFYRDCLRSIQGPQGETYTFGYEYHSDESPFANTEHLLSSITDPRGFLAISNRYTYCYYQGRTNATRYPRVTRQEDALGHVTTMVYSNNAGSNYLSTVDFPDGTSASYVHYSHHSPPESMTDESARSIQFAKNTNEQIIAVTDRMGNITTLDYDLGRRVLTSVTNAQGQVLAMEYTIVAQSFINPIHSSHTVAFTFDELTRIRYPDGAIEQYLYDTRGNPTGFVDRADNFWGYTVNAQGYPTRVRLPNGGEVTQEWNADGTLARQIDPDGVQESFGYDLAFRRIAMTNASGVKRLQYDAHDRVTNVIDEAGHSFSAAYDANGNLVQFSDPYGLSQRLSYDPMNRLTQAVDRLNHAVQFEYDAAGRLHATHDAAGREWAFYYNAQGWETGYRCGGQSWSNVLDAEGICLQSRSPAGREWNKSADLLGDNTNITDAAGRSLHVTYDAMRRPVSLTDALGRTLHYQYHALGQPCFAGISGAGRITNAFNSLGQLAGISDANSNLWAIAYTAAGRLQSVTDPLGQAVQWVYDSAGRRAAQLAPAGSTTATNRFKYNATGALTNFTGADGLALSYSYDARGDWLQANEVVVSRDAEGRITNTLINGANYDAEHNADGSIRSLGYNNHSLVVGYEYDAANGSLIRVTNNLNAGAVELQYDPDGLLTNWIRANGLNASFAYNPGGLLTGLHDSTLAVFQVRYDAAGQPTQHVATALLDPAEALQSSSELHTYDAASAIGGAYACDPQGRVTNTPHGAIEWDSAHRASRVGASSYSHDGWGSPLSRAENGQTNLYDYNYALGHAGLLAERDGATGAARRYHVWTPSGILLFSLEIEGGASTRYPHYDPAGNVLALSDDAGQPADAYAYDPYGRLLAHQGASSQPFTFAGRQGVRREGSNDLYLAGARLYDARTGRFLSREPLWPQWTDPRQVNPYQYALQSPISHADANGLIAGAALLSEFKARMDDLQKAVAECNEAAADARMDMGVWKSLSQERRLQEMADPKARADMWKKIFNREKLNQARKDRMRIVIAFVAGNRQAIRKALAHVNAAQQMLNEKRAEFDRNEEARIRKAQYKLSQIRADAELDLARGDWQAAKKKMDDINNELRKGVNLNAEHQQLELDKYRYGLQEMLEMENNLRQQL